MADAPEGRWTVAGAVASVVAAAIAIIAYFTTSSTGTSAPPSTNNSSPTVAAPSVGGAGSPDESTPNIGPTLQPESPNAPTVRHQGVVTLALGGNTVDLDAPATDPQWQSGQSDITFQDDLAITQHFNGINISGPSLILGETPADYSTCRSSTGYTTGAINIDRHKPGEYICVKTDEGRYSAIRLIDLNPNEIKIDIVTYDPPGS